MIGKWKLPEIRIIRRGRGRSHYDPSENAIYLRLRKSQFDQPFDLKRLREHPEKMALQFLIHELVHWAQYYPMTKEELETMRKYRGYSWDETAKSFKKLPLIEKHAMWIDGDGYDIWK